MGPKNMKVESDSKVIKAKIESEEPESKIREVHRFVKWILCIASVVSILIVINQIFKPTFGVTLLQTSYSYALIGLFLFASYLLYPIKKHLNHLGRLFLLIDFGLAFLSLWISILFMVKGFDIINAGWMMEAPMPYLLFALIYVLLILEAVRRSSGLILFLVICFFCVFPLFSKYMPSLLEGVSFSLPRTVNYHVFSSESILGVPIQVFGELLVGYMVLGTALVATGGGDFFMRCASALLGKRRGGAAKTSIITSALFGSMSSSVISNVVTVGSITIPAMKRSGFPAIYAAAIESCASTGDMLMPPIMGATAFLMASFLNVPYLSVAIAASIPSLLYYTCLVVQADAYAATHNIGGMPADEIPSFREALIEGWYFILSIFVLILFLLLKQEARAPFYATAFLLVIANTRKSTRFTGEKTMDFILENGRSLASLVPLFAGIGMIIGSLSVTGVAHAMTREIVALAGNSVFLLLLLGAVASYILGMGMTMTACYIFLAITVAPALINMGLNPLACHLYVLYCGMLSYITPPVAVAALAASSIAGTPYMRTGYLAMRLGLVTFIIPFCFAVNPALILQGPILDIITSTFTAGIGVILMASALEGYLIGVGKLALGSGNSSNWKDLILRFAVFLSGILMLIPEKITDVVGILLGMLAIVICIILRRSGVPPTVEADSMRK
jgi:TRAP transporter 4TM/12TM fusion protein